MTRSKRNRDSVQVQIAAKLASVNGPLEYCVHSSHSASAEVSLQLVKLVSVLLCLFWCPIYLLFARGSLHQGHEQFSDESRGRKCTFMSLSALLCEQRQNIIRPFRQMVRLSLKRVIRLLSQGKNKRVAHGGVHLVKILFACWGRIHSSVELERSSKQSMESTWASKKNTLLAHISFLAISALHVLCQLYCARLSGPRVNQSVSRRRLLLDAVFLHKAKTATLTLTSRLIFTHKSFVPYGENIGPPGHGSRAEGFLAHRSIIVKLFNTTSASLTQKIIIFCLSIIPLNSRVSEHLRNSYF